VDTGSASVEDWDSLEGKPAGLVSGSIQVVLNDTSGNLDANRITGLIASASFATSASYAISASHEIIKEVSSSYADFAENANIANTATQATIALGVAYTNITGKPTLVSGSSQIDISGTVGLLDGTRVSGLIPSASYAITASHALNVSSPAWTSITGKPDGLVSSSAQIDLSQATGIAANATDAVNADNILLTPDGTNTNRYVPFTATDNGDGALLTDPGILYNPSNNTLTATTFNGNLSGNATSATSADTATSASHAVNADSAITANSATTAGFASTATSASHALIADTAPTSDFASEAEKVVFAVQNNTGGTLEKGTPVHVTGTTNGTSLVIAADASNSATMPAHGILMQQLTAGADGDAAILGQITGVNTSDFASGDTIYVAAGGGYTNQKPTGSNLIQNLGIVKKVDASNGTGEIFGSGRSNDLPNITDGYIWAGNADGVPTAQSTASFAKTNVDNNFTADQTFNNISVNGTGSFSYIQSVTGSAKIIGDAFLVLNNDSPAERYAGIKVIDSGSTAATASLLFDSLENNWFYQYE